MKSLRLSGVVAAAVILGCSAAAEADLAAPKGPVVLTVVGDIANANRGPSDPPVDRFLDHHAQKFDSAAAFDLQMLEALGMVAPRAARSGSCSSASGSLVPTWVPARSCRASSARAAPASCSIRDA